MNSRTVLIAGEREVDPDLRAALNHRGYEVVSRAGAAESLNFVTCANGSLAAVMLDLNMPEGDGIEFLRDVRRICPTTPVFVFSGVSTPSEELEAMASGATDVLRGPFSGQGFIDAIGGAIAPDEPARPAPPKLKNGTLENGTNGDCLTVSSENPVMQAIYRNLKQIAMSDVPIIIRGETGVGKEVLARRIVALSSRASKPFLKMNCAAVPSELLESELFGYERGAFTGAFKSTPGRFETANGGTLMLDEIGDMEFKLQSKLLHVLQDNEFQRLGGRELVRVNVRVIAATHCNLEKAIHDGTFRQDLYYRLNVVSLHLPPLRERKDEILPLAEHFIRKYSTADIAPPSITPELQEVLLSHSWPGNVRELENAMRRLVVFAEPEMIIRFLETGIDRDGSTGLCENPAPVPAVKELPCGNPPKRTVLPNMSALESAKQAAEADAILKALEMSRWNRRRAAALLDIRYKALLYKMKKLGIRGDVDSDPEPPESTAAAAAGVGRHS